MALANSLSGIPWIIKPLWGFISDCFPILGYRRKPYLTIFGFVGVISWLFMSLVVSAPWMAICTMFCIQISCAFCNVIGEALVVEESQKAGASQAEASKYVTTFFAVRSIGIILTAYSSGIILEVLDKRHVFFITACFPLMMVLASAILNEKKNVSHEGPTVCGQLSEIYKFIKKPVILTPICFILIFTMMPTSADAMFYYYTNELNFKPEFMGRLKFACGVASLGGIIIYNKWLKAVSFKSMFTSTTLICCCLGLTQLLLVFQLNHRAGVSDEWFSLSGGFIAQAFAELNTMPLLVLCCRICPKNIEGSLYALLMSTINLGTLVSYQLGGLLTFAMGITKTNFDNLWILVLVCNLSYLLPLPMLAFVKIADSKAEIKEPAETEENGCDTV